MRYRWSARGAEENDGPDDDWTPDAELGDLAAVYDEQLREEIGQFGVAVFGLTGVGKSSLVNAIFGVDIADTGIGDPVTRGVNRYENSTGTLVLWDCEGFELGASKPRDWLRAQIRDNRRNALRSGRTEDLFDVAWYAVSAHSRRLEPGQVQLIKDLDDLGVPVVLVMTQVPVRDGEISPSALEFAQILADKKLPIVGGRPVLTAAVADEFDGTAVHGLQDLLDTTSAAVPEGRRKAFAAAQRIDLTVKLRYARSWIAGTAAFAGGVGFVPVPFADAAVLVPTQAGLMMRIAAIYGIPKDQAAKLALGMTGLASQGGKLAVASLIGLIPGVGSVINAAVASTITATMGESWRFVCERVLVGKLDLNDVTNVANLAQLFRSGLRRKVNLDGTAQD